MAPGIVMIGTGQAAAQAADTLRQRGYEGPITLIGAETCLPYHRPPLSKQYLSGTTDRARMLLRREEHYAQRRVELRLGRRAVVIDRRAQRVCLDDGTEVEYEALLLATGSRPRTLACPGADLDGVHYLRTIADADALRGKCLQGRRLVIIGGGYIGLEVAATARRLGLTVTVIEAAERVMQRTVSPVISAFFESKHAEQGVRILCGVGVKQLVAHNRGREVRAVICADGSEHPADLVAVGIGVEPEQELARQAHIDCAGGILVDERCRTSDPLIFAAGDCTNHPSVRFGGRARLESVNNAFEQGTTAALNMMGGAAVHDKVPWFWSDQLDLKLIIVGLSGGSDTCVVRDSTASGSLAVFHLREGELMAAETINSPKEQMAARKLIAARARPNPGKLANPAVALEDCL